MMMRILVFCAVGLSFLLYMKHEEKKARQETASAREASAGADSCAEKHLCLTVYVAPWCPACKSIEPFLRESLVSSRAKKDFGMKVIVGAERKPGDNQKTADALGAGAIVDPGEQMLAKLGVSYFPSFFVIDKEGSVILQGDEARQWAQERL